MSADEAKSLVEDAEIGGPLVDWKAKGSTLNTSGLKTSRERRRTNSRSCARTVT